MDTFKPECAFILVACKSIGHDYFVDGSINIEKEKRTLQPNTFIYISFVSFSALLCVFVCVCEDQFKSHFISISVVENTRLGICLKLKKNYDDVWSLWIAK